MSFSRKIAVSVAVVALALGACDDSGVGPDGGGHGAPLDQISAGVVHTCWLNTSTGQARCWGRNFFGAVGDGTTSPSQPTPVDVDQSVLGGITFDQIAAGIGLTCGLDTSTGQAYCWGWNPVGQIGDGTNVQRTRPVKVDQSWTSPVSVDR